VQDLLKILREGSLEIASRLGAGPVQLSMPTDGRGPRIKVSVTKGHAAELPAQISMNVGGRRVEVPLEVVEDYQNYAPF
jgi:hypothetical protein